MAQQAPGATASSVSTAAQPETVRRWLCEVAYLPARSTWRREVTLRADAERILAVLIDSQTVYSFQVQGTTLATALDNERIQFDPHTQTWRSDFRGLASGQGRCEAVQ